MCDGHHLRGASVVHAFRSVGCRRVDGPGVQDLVHDGVPNVETRTLRHLLPAKNAFTCSLEEICVFENGSRLKHDLNRQILANPGLVGHVLDRETAEVIVHLPALTVAWDEPAIENLEGSILDRPVKEPWRNVFQRITRPPFVGG